MHALECSNLIRCNFNLTLVLFGHAGGEAAGKLAPGQAPGSLTISEVDTDNPAVVATTPRAAQPEESSPPQSNASGGTKLGKLYR